MQFIDILRTQNLEACMQVEEIWTVNGKTLTRKTGIFKVKNLEWRKLRLFEYKNVCKIVPCHKGDTTYLYVQVDDREKSFFHRG